MRKSKKKNVKVLSIIMHVGRVNCSVRGFT
jgi:hypothetical protein